MIELENHHSGELERRKISLAPNVSVADFIDIDFDSLAWQDEASCNSSDPEVFFVGKGKSTSLAKSICQECVVIEECREYAIQTIQPEGIWGGLTNIERRKIRRARRKSQGKGSNEEKKTA